MAGATFALLFVGAIGEIVRRGITSADGLSSFAAASTWVGLAFGAIALWTAAVAVRFSIQSSRETDAGEILLARANAAQSRQSAWVSFGLLLALLIGFILVQLVFMNDGKIQKTFLQWELMRDSAMDVASAFLINIKLAVISQIFVMVFGLLLAVARLTPGRAGAPIRFLAVAYIDLMRAVPAIIVLYLIGFGLPITNLPIISSLSTEWFAILALTLTYSAYVAEIYRSGIASIHPSQWSASRSLGFSYAQTLRYFILPQSIRIVVPPMLSSFIALQKDTSLVNVIGTMDAFNQAKFYASSSFNLSSVTVVAIFFVIITIPQTRFVDWMLTRSANRKRG
ncbi:amino acid ABC transporter permease [Sinorhizobium meliloti]|uniref:amino acid ABC transporter permease n=1 Tax=Rhizobium meliloti TaxID=382 RepID=UPI00398D26F5